jgi:DnaJ-class molecular chaperone
MKITCVNNVQCPSCKGKGHVFFGPALLNVVGWFIYPFERNNPAGISRVECRQCDGKGYVSYPREKTPAEETNL